MYKQFSACIKTDKRAGRQALGFTCGTLVPPLNCSRDYPTPALAEQVTGLAPGRLCMQTPLDFGPSRGLWSRLPFLGGRTIPQAFRRSWKTHTHLVSEPSPRPPRRGVRGLAADRPLCHPKGLVTVPAVTTRPPPDWLERLGSLGFRGSPQFGCIADRCLDREAARATPTSLGRTPGCKAATQWVTFLTPLASNPEGLKDR